MHHHPSLKTKQYQFRTAEQYILDAPPTIQLSSLKKMTCREYQLNERQFYYLHKKVKYQQLGVEELVQGLEEEGYEVHHTGVESPKDIPEIFIAVSPKMKNLYHQYKDVISFDLTFNLIKDRHPSGKKWKLGCFVATSAAKRITPLGLVVCLHETAETYCQIFKTYFGIMGSSPAVLVTDEEKAVRAALSELRDEGDFTGIHLLDSFHILKNVRKKLEVKEHLVYFRKLIHCRNR